MCPSEPVKFSVSRFPNGHYGINTYLGTCNSYFANGSLKEFYRCKKQSSIRRPSVAVFAGDLSRWDGPHVNNVRFFGYRHGTSTGDDRDPSAIEVPADKRAAANLVFCDGHIGKTTYIEVFFMEEKQKVLLVGVNLNDGFYFFKSTSKG